MPGSGQGSAGRRPSRRPAATPAAGGGHTPSRMPSPRTSSARASAPRSPAARTSPARTSSARPGAGPGRSRASAAGAVRRGSSGPGAHEPTASRAVFRIVVLASIAVLLAVTLVPTLRSYLRQQGQISALRQQVAAQRVDVTALQKEQARWNDEAYVVQQARERLKFVKVGEKSYTVIDGRPAPKSVPGVASAPAASSSHPWYGQLWESVRVADAGPAALAPAVK